MPDWKPEIRRYLRGLHLPAPREAEIVEERSQHLDDRYESLVRADAVTGSRSSRFQRESAPSVVLPVGTGEANMLKISAVTRKDYAAVSASLRSVTSWTIATPPIASAFWS